MMANLQRQLDQLKKTSPSAKALRLSRMGVSSTLGLLDSGATHPLKKASSRRRRLQAQAGGGDPCRWRQEDALCYSFWSDGD